MLGPLLGFVEESGFILSSKQGSESEICIWAGGECLVEGSVECLDMVLKGLYGSCAVSIGGNV